MMLEDILLSGWPRGREAADHLKAQALVKGFMDKEVAGAVIPQVLERDSNFQV